MSKLDVKGALHRALASQAELEADEEHQESVRYGCTPVAELPERRRATVHGVIRSVTLRPRQGVPALEAELYDGTGSLTLIWLGRRRIGGIECGRSLVARGRLTTHDGRPTLYNAEYELRPSLG